MPTYFRIIFLIMCLFKYGQDFINSLNDHKGSLGVSFKPIAPPRGPYIRNMLTLGFGWRRSSCVKDALIMIKQSAKSKWLVTSNFFHQAAKPLEAPCVLPKGNSRRDFDRSLLVLMILSKSFTSTSSYCSRISGVRTRHFSGATIATRKVPCPYSGDHLPAPTIATSSSITFWRWLFSHVWLLMMPSLLVDDHLNGNFCFVVTSLEHMSCICRAHAPGRKAYTWPQLISGKLANTFDDNTIKMKVNDGHTLKSIEPNIA